MSKIILGYENKFWESNGIKRKILWNSPHLLLSGLTGGGKSVLAQSIVNQLLTEQKELFIP